MASQSADPGGNKNQDRPYVPLSHPFVERLIGTIRREYLDHMVCWTSADLENKLLDFKTYYNHHRTHHSREGRTPETPAPHTVANLRSFRWQAHCRAPIPDTGGCLIFQRVALAAMSRSPWAKTRNEIIHVGVLHRSAFRESRRFTASVSIRQPHGPFCKFRITSDITDRQRDHC